LIAQVISDAVLSAKSAVASLPSSAPELGEVEEVFMPTEEELKPFEPYEDEYDITPEEEEIRRKKRTKSEEIEEYI